MFRRMVGLDIIHWHTYSAASTSGEGEMVNGDGADVLWKAD